MPSVFISVGTPADGSQEAFRDSVIRAVELAGLTPRLMSATDWDYKNPLRGIRRVMSECCGALVIAYTRYEFAGGTERRREGNRPLDRVALPTTWNHIEAAMAYEGMLPLLVVAENGLRQDALLESTSDIRPFWTDATPTISDAEGFLGYVRSWKQDVDAFADARTEKMRQDLQTRELTIGDVFSALPWYEVVGLLITFLGALAAAITFGYRLGAGQWPLG